MAPCTSFFDQERFPHRPTHKNKKLKKSQGNATQLEPKRKSQRTKPSQRTFSTMKNEYQSAIHHTIAGGSEEASVARRASVTRGRRRGTPMYLGCQPTYPFEVLQRKVAAKHKHTHTRHRVAKRHNKNQDELIFFQTQNGTRGLTSKIRSPESKP